MFITEIDYSLMLWDFCPNSIFHYESLDHISSPIMVIRQKTAQQ